MHVRALKQSSLLNNEHEHGSLDLKELDVQKSKRTCREALPSESGRSEFLPYLVQACFVLGRAAPESHVAPETECREKGMVGDPHMCRNCGIKIGACIRVSVNQQTHFWLEHVS